MLLHIGIVSLEALISFPLQTWDDSNTSTGGRGCEYYYGGS